VSADPRLTAAREYLGHARGVKIADLPEAAVVRLAAELRRQLGQVLAMVDEAAEVLGQALADAADYREVRATQPCPSCEASACDLCPDHEADFDLADSFLALAEEFGIEVKR
jgi:hypothetical protein